MLQLTVFRRQFLVENELRCIHGLRRQDSEFSPQALYLAKRVVPLHVGLFDELTTDVYTGENKWALKPFQEYEL